MRLIVRRSAEHEIAEAALWYETRRKDLASRFIAAAEAACDLLRQHPKAGPVLYDQFRRVQTRGFPYVVYYSIRRETVIVHHVLHSARGPDVVREILSQE